MENAVPDWIDAINWNADGLMPVLAQQAGSGDILMVAWMNREALQATLERGEAVYWSRSRKRLWHKGEESGHFQKVLEVRIDCDEDVLLLTVEQVGDIACHTGRHSCFYRRLERNPTSGQLEWVEHAEAPTHTHAPDRHEADSHDEALLARLADTLDSRRHGDPDSSYVARLHSRGANAVLKKIAEEAGEVLMAAKDLGAADTASSADAEGATESATAALVGETADLWFHSLVMLSFYGLRPEQVLAELARREGQAGLEEKALRKARDRERSGDA
ncbi:bifunctional phosphoribosyl-AMP cyclohydrolase/phosphoribosyl-ATP diphosphatase HisIE [soil metagenome]